MPWKQHRGKQALPKADKKLKALYYKNKKDSQTKHNKKGSKFTAYIF